MSVQIAHDGQGYRVYRTELGRDRTYVGPRWNTPREAARYADSISVPFVDPLRAPGEDAHREHPAVPHGSVDGAASSLGSRINGTPGGGRP